MTRPTFVTKAVPMTWGRWETEEVWKRQPLGDQEDCPCPKAPWPQSSERKRLRGAWECELVRRGPGPREKGAHPGLGLGSPELPSLRGDTISLPRFQRVVILSCEY